MPVDLSGQPAALTAPPGGLSANQLDSWLAVAQDGTATVFCGKVELGTGVETALRQIVAEELDLPFGHIRWVQGDTATTVDQGTTTGSQTIKRGGAQLRQAAAEARQALLELASARFGVPTDQLIAAKGAISTKVDPSKKASYGELIGGRRFSRVVTGTAKPKSPDTYTIVGTSVPRVDIPDKAMGTYTYTQDVRLPGMLHGRVIRPAGVGATLTAVNEDSVRHLPGSVKVVRKGNLLGLVAEREEQAIRGAQTLKASWQEPAVLPEMRDLPQTIRTLPSTDRTLVNTGDVEAALGRAARSLQALYTWPFQLHGPVGPSVALADVRDGRATIWSHTQGPHQLRPALAQLLGMPVENVRVIYVEGSGCYGHDGADDVAADAALLSQAVGKPVRVQWMRHDEHGWEPKGPAMVVSVRGGLDAKGNVIAWDYSAWTPTHTARPSGQAGNLLAGQLVGVPAPRPTFVGGDRNARHTYVFDNDRVVVHWLTTPPLRSSALRGLGSPQNTFANESFMDELAAAVGADPVEFRMRHLSDPRAIAVLETVARRAGWDPRPSPKRETPGSRLAMGRGVAFVRYERTEAYVATVAEVEVNRETGLLWVKRVVVAHDCGLIVNPDGVKNQIEGNVIQAISRTLKEEVKFNRSRVTSLDWTAYPILTFPELPEEVEVALINRPTQPSVGAGEPTTPSIPPAIANAVFDATGTRLRTVPFTPDRIKAALERT